MSAKHDVPPRLPNLDQLLAVLPLAETAPTTGTLTTRLVSPFLSDHHLCACSAGVATLRQPGRLQKAYEFAVDVSAGPPDSMFRLVPG